jgi:hypothetical protein
VVGETQPLVILIKTDMKNSYLSFLLVFSIFYAFAQEAPTSKIDIDAYIDDLLLEEESLDEMLVSFTNFNFLYAAINYNSATYFSGRDVDIDQYNIVPQLTYMHSKGFYASVSGIYYSEFEPNWDVTTVTAGFGKSFGKKKLWRYYGSYSYYFYSNDLDNLYNSSASGGLSIRNKKRNLGTQISGTYYFGNELGYQLVSRSFATINVLKTNKHQLKFRPQLSIITGTQIIDLSGGSLEKLLVAPEELVVDDIIVQSSAFGLINTQINLPLLYSTSSFDFELGFNFNFPSELEGETDLKNTSFFNVGVAYLIDL